MTLKINMTAVCYSKSHIYFHLLVKLSIKFILHRTFLENHFDFSEIITSCSSSKWGQSLRIIGNSITLSMSANIVYDLF